MLSIAREEDKPQLEDEIRRADVICVVYAATDGDKSFDTIVRTWLPYVVLKSNMHLLGVV